VRLMRARPSRRPMRVDDEGLHFGEGFSGSLDVVMDDQRVWSFATTDHQPSVTTVEWPKRLRRLLEGTAEVRILAGADELFRGTVAFGSGEGRPSFVDNNGIPIFVDKWGLIQRPFSGRRDAGVVDALVEMTRRVLGIMRDECGIEGWIAFGTLLGAARDGKAIGHDSDVDLCFLSDQSTPAAMAAELWDVARALRRAGLRVQHKSASFITVSFKVGDGGRASLDIYTCFYVGTLLHETATVRAEVPREAILPLREIEFEGHLLPAPADPDTMLRVSYGPDWKVPDPSFRHLPGPEITHRFDGWFGSLMKWRRDWATYNTRVADEGGEPSSFSRWVVPQLDGVDRVVEVGCGAGLDLAAYAAPGRKVLGLDYARPRGGAAVAGADDAQQDAEQESVSSKAFNLDDLRDVLTLGAQASRRDERQAVVARHLLEALSPESGELFWRFCSMTLRHGGTAYVEGVARTPRDAATWVAEHESGRVRSLDPARVVPQVEAAGGRIVSRAGFDEAARAVRTGPPATWRMVVEWDAPTGSAPTMRSTR
jgi:SAM-dependent methyltransferase